MTRSVFGKPAAPARPNPCFCGCGGIVGYGDLVGSRYLYGHAPHERAPAPASAPPRRSAAPPQGDLFGAPSPRSRTGP